MRSFVTEALFVLIAVVGVIVLLQFSRTSSDARGRATALADVRTSAYAVASLEDQAVVDPSEAAALIPEVNEHVGSARRTLTSIGGVPDELSATLDRYATGVGQQLGLLRAGQVDAAERLDDELVDPTFDELERMLLASSDASRQRAETAEQRLRVGSVIVLLVACLLIVLINRRVSATRRRLGREREAEQALHQARLEHEVAERTVELAQANRHNELILASAGDGIVGLDATGRVTFANPIAVELTGRDAAQIVGRPWHDMVHATHPDGSPYPVEDSPLSDVLATGISFSAARDDLQRPDGTFIPIEYAATAMVVGDEVQGAVKVFRDISERRAVETMKNEFISVVSHELRTPLTSIRGSLGLLASRKLGDLSAPGQRMVDIAVENTDRLIRLINDILDLERIDSGAVAMHKTQCTAAEVIAHAMRVVTPAADEAGVRVEIAEVQGRLWADADRLIQTLMNLISNAIKFSPSGGVVSVSARCVDDEIHFDVADQGRGVPADMLETIFGRFQQVDSSDAREKGGTGLGLAISRSIVEQHGGRIWAQSEEGAGSTFTFTVPALAQPNGTPAVAVDEDPDGPIVLVCDDDESIAEVLHNMLASHGYRVVIAKSGDQALERARAVSPAVIVLDLFMPGMDGWSTFEALKADEATATIPVVVLSVVSRDEGGELAKNADTWLTKPILDIALLLRAIDGVINEPRRPHVLVVEDDADLAAGLITSLESDGVRVSAASSEHEALQRCRETHPDLVILDLAIPEGRRCGLIDQLRHDGQLRNAPLILYTAEEIDNDQRQRLRSRNATVVLKSIVSPRRLEEEILNLLDHLTHRPTAATSHRSS